MKLIILYLNLFTFVILTNCLPQQDTSKNADNLSKEYFYYINSSPFNASVLYNDSLIGITPLRFYTINKLDGNLVFKKPGFKNFQFKLQYNNIENNISVNLEQINKFNLVEKERESHFKSKRNYSLIFGSGFITLVSAFTAIHFKNIANDSYDAYQNTSNQSDLDKSNRNDIYSGISLVVMQIAFAGLIYFLFIK